MRKTIGAAFLALTITSFAAHVPGTDFALTPPPGFEPSRQFPGFASRENGATLNVAEIPGAPYAELVAGFDAKNMASRGMEFVSKENVSTSVGPATLIHASQVARGTKWGKWILVFGTPQKTTIMTANFPATLEDSLGIQLRGCLLAVTRFSGPPTSANDGLTFEAEPQAPLKVVRKMGNNLLFTETDRPSLEGPFFVAGAALADNAPFPITSDFVLKRLDKTEALREIKVLQEEPVVIDGRQGITVEGHGLDKQTGKARYVLLTILPSNDGYYIMQGLCARESSEQYRQVFLSIARSFREKPLSR